MSTYTSYDDSQYEDFAIGGFAGTGTLLTMETGWEYTFELLTSIGSFSSFVLSINSLPGLNFFLGNYPLLSAEKTGVNPFSITGNIPWNISDSIVSGTTGGPYELINKGVFLPVSNTPLIFTISSGSSVAMNVRVRRVRLNTDVTTPLA